MTTISSIRQSVKLRMMNRVGKPRKSAPGKNKRANSKRKWDGTQLRTRESIRDFVHIFTSQDRSPRNSKKLQPKPRKSADSRSRRDVKVNKLYYVLFNLYESLTSLYTLFIFYTIPVATSKSNSPDGSIKIFEVRIGFPYNSISIIRSTPAPTHLFVLSA